LTTRPLEVRTPAATLFIDGSSTILPYSPEYTTAPVHPNEMAQGNYVLHYLLFPATTSVILPPFHHGTYTFQIPHNTSSLEDMPPWY
jgi:hypothetical protein